MHVLARIAPYMNKDKLRSLMKAFIDAQFNYCPLIWMFHNRTLNNKINKLHERTLRIVYKDYKSSFDNLLNKDNTFTIHERNLQKLATEMFKIQNNLSPSFLNNIFPPSKNPYEDVIKIFAGQKILEQYTMYRKRLHFMVQNTWALLLNEIKKSNNINEFKAKIKHWKPEGCTGRICKVYIPNLGFLP